MKRNYIIPFFVVHEGCPHKCVFCDQRNITGRQNVRPEEIETTIRKYLSTIPRENTDIEVGFFGGTFTGLAKEEQKALLNAVKPFLLSGDIKGIRLSTRPDFIDKDSLELLKSSGVTFIELGVQSMSDKVLAKIKRGYNADAVARASGLILKEGFGLGHQMMVGLPLSGFEEELYTARKAKGLGASEVRIYPLVVIKDTELAEWWKNGEYVPLNEEEAVNRCASLILYFEANNVKVIRCGLHPSEGLLDNSALLAGPFHPAFRQKAESRIFGMMLRELAARKDVTSVMFNPEDEAAFFGFEKENHVLLKTIFGGDYMRYVVRSGDVVKRTLAFSCGTGTEIIDRKMIWDIGN